MGKTFSQLIDKDLETVKDLLPKIVDANALVTFGDRGVVNVHSCLITEPESVLDAVRITLQGQANQRQVRDLITFELRGKAEVYLVTECIVDDPVVEEYAHFILNELKPLDQSSTEKKLTSGEMLPIIEDPTDQRIWGWIQEDPSISDTIIAQKLGITRQTVNTRRRSLEKMGYPVRKSVKTKSKSVKTK